MSSSSEGEIRPPPSSQGDEKTPPSLPGELQQTREKYWSPPPVPKSEEDGEDDPLGEESDALVKLYQQKQRQLQQQQQLGLPVANSFLEHSITSEDEEVRPSGAGWMPSRYKSPSPNKLAREERRRKRKKKKSPPPLSGPEPPEPDGARANRSFEMDPDIRVPAPRAHARQDSIPPPPPSVNTSHLDDSEAPPPPPAAFPHVPRVPRDTPRDSDPPPPPPYSPPADQAGKQGVVAGGAAEVKDTGISLRAPPANIQNTQKCPPTPLPDSDFDTSASDGEGGPKRSKRSQYNYGNVDFAFLRQLSANLADPGWVVQEGWLQRKSSKKVMGQSIWVKRYFVLGPEALVYYQTVRKRQDCKRPRAVLKLGKDVVLRLTKVDEHRLALQTDEWKLELKADAPTIRTWHQSFVKSQQAEPPSPTVDQDMQGSLAAALAQGSTFNSSVNGSVILLPQRKLAMPSANPPQQQRAGGEASSENSPDNSIMRQVHFDSTDHSYDTKQSYSEPSISEQRESDLLEPTGQRTRTISNMSMSSTLVSTGASEADWQQVMVLLRELQLTQYASKLLAAGFDSVERLCLAEMDDLQDGGEGGPNMRKGHAKALWQRVQKMVGRDERRMGERDVSYIGGERTSKDRLFETVDKDLLLKTRASPSIKTPLLASQVSLGTKIHIVTSDDDDIVTARKRVLDLRHAREQRSSWMFCRKHHPLQAFLLGVPGGLAWFLFDIGAINFATLLLLSTSPIDLDNASELSTSQQLARIATVAGLILVLELTVWLLTAGSCRPLGEVPSRVWNLVLGLVSVLLPVVYAASHSTHWLMEWFPSYTAQERNLSAIGIKSWSWVIGLLAGLVWLGQAFFWLLLYTARWVQDGPVYEKLAGLDDSRVTDSQVRVATAELERLVREREHAVAIATGHHSTSLALRTSTPLDKARTGRARGKSSVASKPSAEAAAWETMELAPAHSQRPSFKSKGEIVVAPAPEDTTDSYTMPHPAALQHCASCGTEEKLLFEAGRTLFACGRCRAEAYCSQLCQKRRWSSHKLVCKPAPLNQPAQARPSAMANNNTNLAINHSRGQKDAPQVGA